MAFRFSINPRTFQSEQISTSDQQKQFLFKLAQTLSEIENAINQLANPSAISATGNLGTISSNTNFNANGTQIVVVVFTFSANVTLTLQNLPVGATVVLAPTALGAHTLKLAATNPAGVAYATITLTYAGGGNAIDMIGTGQAFGAGVNITYVGGTLAGPALNLVGS